MIPVQTIGILHQRVDTHYLQLYHAPPYSNAVLQKVCMIYSLIAVLNYSQYLDILSYPIPFHLQSQIPSHTPQKAHYIITSKHTRQPSPNSFL